MRNYLKAIGSGYLKIILTVLVGLWMVPFTLKFLTNAEYGIFAIAGDILLWLGLFQLGTGASLSARAAHLLGQKNTKTLGELASTALVMQTVAAVFVVAVGGLIALNLDWLFPSSSPIRGLESIFFILVIGASIQIIAQVFNGLLAANKQIHIENYLGIVLFVMQTLITIVLLLMGLKLLALAIASVLSITIISIISYWRVRKWMPDINLNLNKFNIKHVKELFGNGVWFTVGGLAGILILNTDRFIIGRYISLEMVTAFVITGKLYFIADKMHGQIFNVIRPYFGQLHGVGKSNLILRIYESAFSASLLLSGLMASVIFILNKWFVVSWVGPSYYLGDFISFLFSINFILQSSVLPNRVLLSSTLFKVKSNATFRVFEGFFNLGLSVLFVIKFGLEGVLIASILGSILFSALAMNILSRDYFFQFNEKISKSIYLNYFVLIVLVSCFKISYDGGGYLIVLPVLVLLLICVVLIKRNKFFKEFYVQINKKIKKKSPIF